MNNEPIYSAEVVGLCEVADRTVELTLRTVDSPAPEWQPGAHIDLILTSRLTRQYSLCGDPADRSALTIAVMREPGGGRGGSSFVHNMVKVGSALRIRGPRNNFPLVDAERYLFIAGGIGITPLLPMIRAVEARGSRWSLVYRARNRASMAYLSELSILADSSPSGDFAAVPGDEVERLDLDALLGAATAGTEVYCCGPEPLVAAVEQRCAAWLPGALHIERFSAKPPDPNAIDEEFEVECARSGVTVCVPPGKSILETLDEAGVFATASCLEGVCGMCQTAVRDGVPEHRDYVLTPLERQENETMMICCSRARSARLVLEL